MSYSISQFPRQKLPDSKKTEEWYKECIDQATYALDHNSDYVRKSLLNKQSNYDLRNGIVNIEDVKQYVDVYELGTDTLPEGFRHIGRGNAYINLLVGEEIARGTKFSVFISSADKTGVSKKEEAMKALYLDKINAQLKASDGQDEVALRNYERYIKYDWQDIREQTASKILKAEVQKNKLPWMFTMSFEDALTVGEEIMCCELHGWQPIARRCDPRAILTMGSNNQSNRVEDSDIIVEYQYLSPGTVIDRYYRYLSPDDIDTLEEKSQTRSNLIEWPHAPVQLVTGEDGTSSGSSLVALSMNEMDVFSNFWDHSGNIRVATVNWRSRRKLQKRTYYDEFGYEREDFVHEYYEADESKGEVLEDVWVNEWWEGTKIGSDIYVNVKPIAYRGASLANVSKGTPNYIGQLYNINGGPTQSMVDIIKPIDYTFDLVFWKRDKEIAKHLGDPLLINAAMVPQDWDPDLWMDYLADKGFGWLDPSQEILKGPSRGESAGAFNQLTATRLSGSTGNSIAMYTEVLMSLEDTLGKITGISPQREAQVQTSETVGGIQRALNQSAHITEKWFAYHDDFKQRFLQKFLELVKYSYKKHPKNAQYILDDVGLDMVSNYDEFLECDYDVHISNAKQDNELMELLKAHAQAALQNGQMAYSDLVAISKSESTQQIARRLDESRQRILNEQKELEQQKAENALQLQQSKENFERYKMENDNIQKEADRQAKIQVAIISAQSKRDGDTDNDGIADAAELAKESMRLAHESRENAKDRSHEASENAKDREVERKKIAAQKAKPQTAKK